MSGGLLAPASFFWAAQARRRARALGLKPLYSCARDAYLDRRCEERIGPRFGIERRYLHVSSAAVADATGGGLDWLERPWDHPTVAMLPRLSDLDGETKALARLGPRALARISPQAGAWAFRKQPTQ